MPEAKAILDERGFFYKRGVSRERLVALLNRSDRGLLSYERCPVSELRQFCVDRKLVKKQRAGKAELAAALEQADDDPEFHCFSDLAPELRLIVYGHYLESIEQGTAPTQPPLARVSRMLREEALPVFYGEHRFLILGGTANAHVVTLARLSKTAIAMITTMSEGHLRLIRRLRLRADIAMHRQYGGLECDIDVGGRRGSPRIESLGDNEGDWLARTDKGPRITKEKLSEALDEMASRSEGKALQRIDLRSLNRALWPWDTEDWD